MIRIVKICLLSLAFVVWGPSEITVSGTLRDDNREDALDEPEAYANTIRQFLNKVDGGQ